MNKPIRDLLSDREMERGPVTEPSQMTAHWRLNRESDGVAWLFLDREGESANTISAEVLEELDALLACLEEEPARGLILRSAKANGFAAGADIHDFRGATESEDVAEKMRRAHQVVDRLEALRCPTVAVIHGFCLGGGLELALACDTRIATPDAKLGFPEVMLGLHPGLGGTFRLPGLIDPVEAMTMMLTGKSAHAEKARALGLVDAVVEERHVAAAAHAAVAGEIETDRGGLKAFALSTRPARRIAADQMRRKTEKRASRENYRAPFALIDMWEEHGGDKEAMQRAEIRSFADLIVSGSAQNLIRVFFLREKLKAKGGGNAAIAHVHVIGAGAMGGDIAAWCALKGLNVSLGDLDPKVLAKAVGRAAELFEKKLHSGPDRRDARDRLIPDFVGDGVMKADIVIEAIAEKPEAKIALYAEIETRMKAEAVLATNTSSIPLETLRKKLVRPERFVGLHFFNPVAKMELVEIVAHDGADADSLRVARALCGMIDRLPAPVTSAPGFLVNRVLTPCLLEAVLMIDEGVAPETIDAAAEGFGMAMGPAEVADQVGLDICVDVAESLRERLDQPMPETPQWLRERIENGALGRKTGRGIYEYDKDGAPKKKTDAAPPEPSMVDRLILPMVNASAACLREGVVEDADTLDAAMIFAAGFAPFRGGPAAYARARGVDEIRNALVDLEQQLGERFHPDEGLDKLNAAK